MKILLIRGPNNKKAIDLSHYTFSEPRGLQLLAGFFSKNHEVELFDMMVEKKSIEKKIKEGHYDLCGISSSCNDIFIIKELAKKIKKVKDMPIFIGGFQVKKTPQYFLSKNIDYIVLDTTKKNFQLISDEVENGKPFESSGILKKFDNLEKCNKTFVDDVFLCDRRYTEKYMNSYSYFIYKPVVLLEFYKEKDLISSIKDLKQKNVTFIDMDFFKEKEKIDNFFEKMSNLNIKKKILVYGTRESLENCSDSFENYRRNGLHSVIMFLGKRDERDHKIIEKLQNAGINVWVYFNLYPEFDKNDFKILRKRIGELKASVVTLYPLNPFYDNEIYKKYENRLLYKNELRANRYPGYVLINPVNMNLRAYYIEILKTTIYSYRYEVFKFPFVYGINNSLIFFYKSITLLFKFLKLIRIS